MFSLEESAIPRYDVCPGVAGYFDEAVGRSYDRVVGLARYCESVYSAATNLGNVGYSYRGFVRQKQSPSPPYLPRLPERAFSALTVI